MTSQSTEKAMKRTLIRYRTKPEQAERNAELIAAVFAELKAVRPDGTRYLSLRLEDDTFIHFVETAADDGVSALPKLPAFQAFQSGIRERCAEPPLVKDATIVGNYRMLDELSCETDDITPKAPSAVDIESLLVAMRPKLHRYCARMVGSVIDGEDVLQDALIKAVEAFAAAGPLRHPKPGCSGSRITPRWISCAAVPGRKRCNRARRWR